MGNLDLSVREDSACLGCSPLERRHFSLDFLSQAWQSVSSLGVFLFVNKLFGKASMVHYSLMSYEGFYSFKNL